MSSIVILSPEVRSIPYFSSFPSEEKTVTIPRPLINESINYKTVYDIEKINLKTLIAIIENRIYLSLDNDELIKELIWRMGETKKTFDKIKDLPLSIQDELKPYLSKIYSTYIYGIRCNVTLDDNICSRIVYFNNLRLLKWVRSRGYYSTIVRYFANKISEEYLWSDKDYGRAIINKNDEMRQYLLDNGCQWKNKWTCAAAAYIGNLKMLKWARDNGCSWDEYTCSDAAGHGHFEVLKWAWENGCPWDKKTCESAARNGYLDILKWAREKKCKWDEDTFSSAVKSGRLDILEWLYENGCPWDVDACANAAKIGRLDILKWLHERGCPWNEYTVKYAIINKDTEMIVWARENGCHVPAT